MNKSIIKYVLILIIGFVFFSGCAKKAYYVAEQTPQYYKFNKNKPLTKDTEAETLISPYRNSMAKEMDEVLVYSEVELNKGKPNSTLGNWITDIILEQTQKNSKEKLACAFQNYGGIRINSMPAGPITKGKIFEVMPFENMTVILHIPGETLRKLCDRIVAYGGWPMSKGIRFEMGDDRTAKHIMVQEEPLNDDKIYHIVLADYVANGGDRCDFLEDADRTETGILIRDLIIDYLREMKVKGEKINTTYEERITPSNLDD